MPLPEPKAAPPALAARGARLGSCVLLAFGPALAAEEAALALPELGRAASWGLLCCLPLLGGFLGAMRRALEGSRAADRLEAELRSEADRQRLRPWLARSERLALSAGGLRLVCHLAFALLLANEIAAGAPLLALDMLIAVAFATPLLLGVDEVLTQVLSGPRFDRFVLRILPAWGVLQFPLTAPVAWLALVRRGLLRALGRRLPTQHERRMVDDLRQVIEGSEIEGELGESERAIIENVVEFHDIDVAAIMVPRTEIHAIELSAGPKAALKAFAESAHSRMPVHDGSLDHVLGWISARDLLQVVAEDRLEDCDLRALLRPARFVPETKRVSALLSELRAGREAMAFVLDEYGGTAGLVTMSDILAEIVGDLRDEHDEEPPAAIRHLSSELAEVRGDARLAEVNSALGLELPEEEGYETLAGYVLSQLGRFPRGGESFERGPVEFTVVEATDRRVLVVRVRRRALLARA